jgi:hypothetical protein
MRAFPFLLLIVLLFTTASADAGIQVNPHWVNANMDGATTVFLTFGGAAGFVPGEAVWCGEVMDAAPAVGLRPVPGTIFGTLPSRLNLSTASGNGGFTDIMSIPPSVSRRAYQAAASGARSTFFYVRHFISTTAAPDEYVAVTCELTGGAAVSPFALVNIALAFADQEVLPSVRQGNLPPSFSALITFTGTGQLRGRWEIVRPGDPPPDEQDLLTEATLPLEQRGRQKRYTELERFSIYLPPTGRFELPGPDSSRLPADVTGLYMILLRIEASNDPQSLSHAEQVGAEPVAVPAGGVAGFAIPPLRYFVGGGPASTSGQLALMQPADLASVPTNLPADLSWVEFPSASYYRVVVIDPANTVIATALLRRGIGVYRLPPWIWTKSDARQISWSVEALDDGGAILTKSRWRTLRRQESSEELQQHQ